MAKLNVSLHVFDLTDLSKVIQECLDVNINMFHIDIMDGKFVKNFALCQRHLQDIKEKYENVILDAHMMIENPQDYVEEFAKVKADIFNFHYESIKDSEKIKQIIKKIKSNNMKVSIMLDLETDINLIKEFVIDLDIISIMSIKTGFPGQQMNKDFIKRIEEVSELKKINKNLIIQVDGGVREETYEKMILAGADILVVGHFLLNQNFKTQLDKINQVKK